jgi:hypothetical protein
MLIGCGLRRAELLGLTLESIQQPEDQWVIADLVGKGGHDVTEGALGRDGQRLREPALTSSPRTISGAHVRGSVTWLAANWIRSNSCWGTSRSKRRNAILDASSDCDAPSTTALESNQTSLDRFGRGADDGKRPPLATFGD